MTRLVSLAAKSLAVLLLGSAALSVNLHAQSDALTITVPFPFTVGAQTLPPGTYRFSMESSHFLLTVINGKTNKMEAFVVHPELQRTPEPHGLLVFRNSRGGSILSEVHFAGSEEFTELPQPHRAPKRVTMRASTADASSAARR